MRFFILCCMILAVVADKGQHDVNKEPSGAADTPFVQRELIDLGIEIELHRFIVKFKDLIPEGFDLGPQIIKLIPEESSIAVILPTVGGLQWWLLRPDVDFVEEDRKLTLQSSGLEETPYGIDMVNALSVSDEFVSNRKVCIIDSGYNLDHPDLPNDSDIVTGTDGEKSWGEDTDGHGTHVAGVIAAIGGNDQGVKGVVRNGKLKLHIIRVFGDPLFGEDGSYEGNESVWASDLVGAVVECQKAGANIVNMSLGAPDSTRLEGITYWRMLNKNILLIAAAGNDGSADHSYPASYKSVLSVAAVDNKKGHASFSQFNDQIDIAAPGVDILSTVSGDEYDSFEGTSMAAPHVAGVAALIWSHFPNKSATEVRDALLMTAEDLGALGRDDYFGYGLVQADKALEYLAGDRTAPPVAPPVASPTDSSPTGGQGNFDAPSPTNSSPTGGQGNFNAPSPSPTVSSPTANLNGLGSPSSLAVRHLAMKYQGIVSFTLYGFYLWL